MMLALSAMLQIADNLLLDSAAVSPLRERWRHILDGFRCHYLSGARPGIRDFLRTHQVEPDMVLLSALVSADQEYSFRLAHGRPLEAYLDEFHEVRADAGRLRDLVRAECLYRAVYSVPLSRADLHRRFPTIADEIPLEQIVQLAEGLRIAESFDGAGRFFVAQQLGAGGMGRVYRAFDRQQQAIVALKVMRGFSPDRLYRFRNEFRSLTEIEHPNLVRLYEFFSDGEKWFFTMELVEGVTFFQYVRTGVLSVPSFIDSRRDGETDSSPTRDWEWTASKEVEPDLPDIPRLRGALAQLAVGVAALHSHGKLHRDLKPSNVLVRDSGDVVILDFGLVSDYGETCSQQPGDGVGWESGIRGTEESQIVGTPGYMSPEQSRRQALTPASDWYSVGVMLHEALMGTRPALGGPLVAPAALRPGIPADLSDLCLALLQPAPALRPTAEQVLRALCPSSPQVAAAVPPAAAWDDELVGRVAWLRELHEALGRVERGAAELIRVTGPSGVGKSHLIQGFLQDIEADGRGLVLAGRCYEFESVPHKAIDTLLDPLVRYLRHLPADSARDVMPRDIAALSLVFPVLCRVASVFSAPSRPAEMPDRSEMRRRAMFAFRELITRIGERQPVIMFIDDLQWGDADSMAMLRELLRPPFPPRILLLVAYRNEQHDKSPGVAALLAACDSGQIPVAPPFQIDVLTREEAVQLAVRELGRHGRPSWSKAEWIACQTRGLPIFICELARALARSQDWRSTTPDMDLDEVLGRRVVSLPPEARGLLEVLGVAGRPLKRREVQRAAGSDRLERRAWALLRSDRLIRTWGPGPDDEVEVYHDLIREAILRRLAPVALVTHHRSLARALESGSDADPEVIADHFCAAGESRRAAHYYTLAACRAADSLAFDLAARLYRLALDLDDHPDQQRELRRCLAESLANGGRSGEAAAEYLLLADQTEQSKSNQMRRKAAYHLCVSGRIDAGRRELSRCLQPLGMSMSESARGALLAMLWDRMRLALRGRMYRLRPEEAVPLANLHAIDTCWDATVGLTMVDTLEGAAFQSRHLLLALRAGEPYRLGRALCWQASHVATGGCGMARRVERLLDTAETLLSSVESPHARGLLALSRGIARYFLGSWRQALADFDQAEFVFQEQCTGVAWELATTRAFALWSMYFLGEVRRLRDRLPVLLQTVKQQADILAEASMVNFGGVLHWLAEDDPAGARQALEQAMVPWAGARFRTQHFTSLAGHAQVDLYCQEGHVAWRRISTEWPGLRNSMLLRIEAIRIYMLHLRARCALAAVQQGMPASLLRGAARDARRLERERAPWSRPLALLIRAALASFRRDLPAACSLLGQAADRLAELEMRLFANCARFQQLELLAQTSGEPQRQALRHWFASQQIARPERMAALFVTGFPARIAGACPRFV